MFSFSRLSVQWLLLFLIFYLFHGYGECIVLRAYISQHGLHGEIEFSQKNLSTVSIRTNLKPTLEFPEQIWKWSIHEFPVDYTDISDSRCSTANLGGEIVDLTDELGYLMIPGKDQVEFESTSVLVGDKGLWGKSLVLRTVEHHRVICASIVSTDGAVEKMAVAKFRYPVAGSIHFRWLAAKDFDQSDTYITSDLYFVKTMPDKISFSSHNWKIYVTDIFDKTTASFEDNCNVLQLVFDPEIKGPGQGIGDLDTRLGKLKIAVDAAQSRLKMTFKDENFNVLPSDLDEQKRNLYIVIFDAKHPDSFLSCAKIRTVQPKIIKTLINMDGVRGEVEFSQRSPFDPTWARFQLGASDSEYESSLRFVSSINTYQISELPTKMTTADYSKICETTGNMYNPLNRDFKEIPPPGMGTQDQYPVGDILGKYKDRTEYLNHKYLLPGLSNELNGHYWDIFLPLQGVHSINHRSLVIKRHESRPPLCGIMHEYEFNTKYQTAMLNAEVTLRYPLVGRILLRQPLDRPWEDTIILMEYLVHADGANLNNTIDHRWAVHEYPPGKDFYNWTARCLSAGRVYDPHGVDIDMRNPGENCKFGLEGLCRIGDLSTRHVMLMVAGKRVDGDSLTRKLFTDNVIALSGRYSVLRKSFVIYDDHGPVARGERMACSIINRTYRRKAVVKEWFGNGETVTFGGKLEFIQQNEYDIVNTEVEFTDLVNIQSYKVHSAPVERELEFPCENTTLYDTYNPYHIPKGRSPPPEKGTPDQYELGDLSGKYGLLTGLKKYSTYFNETQLTLFGPNSIIGRSVVLHKHNTKDRRWACSSVERGYSPAEARELRAIASFHHPGGFAYGYVRMTQLVYNDDSKSDTVIEVKLRHPGRQDRNVTFNHKWAVFVNPVGVDAAVQVTDTRCVAGGYRWNPFFTQLADPLNEDLYNEECGPDNPLRCHVGDLSSRLGNINIGYMRQIFVDSNLPLEGAVSAMGRSIVVMGPDGISSRFACANIEPDKDIIKYANIRRPPRFVVAQFIEDVRQVMGIPEWMLTVDSRKTRTLHQNTCIQFLMHFQGPHASTLELDFSRLLGTGKLEQPSIFIPGYVNTKRKTSLSYRQCGVRDPNEKFIRKSAFSTAFDVSGANSGSPHQVVILGCVLSNLVILIFYSKS